MQFMIKANPPFWPDNLPSFCKCCIEYLGMDLICSRIKVSKEQGIKLTLLVFNAHGAAALKTSWPKLR